MNTNLSKELNFSGLLKFTFPSIITLMLTSLYTIVDGYFVSNYIGTDALSAVNIAFPIHSIILAISLMFGAGGSAIIAKNIGEKNYDKANKNFSMISFTAVVIGLLVIVLSYIFAEPLLIMLGANETILPYALDYYRVMALFLPFAILQLTYLSFFISAGKPELLSLCFVGGVLNMVLDYVLIAVLDMGMAGAAIATGVNFLVPAIGGLIFFFKNKNGLHYTKFKLNLKVIGEASFNGSSEMISNLASTITTTIFNILMMRFMGPNGVAAITVMLYSQFLMSSLFLGFSLGLGPIISYNYGAKNKKYLAKVIKMSLIFTIVTSIIIFIASFVFAEDISKIFAADNLEVLELSTTALKLFSVSFLFSGINILVSGLYTALSNGKMSAILSISRAFVFMLLGIFGLAYLYQHTGLFLSIPFAEFGALILSIIALFKIKKYL